MPAILQLRSVPACISLSPDEKFATACAWCPTRSEADAWAKKHGIPLSHGCCDSCFAKQMAEIEALP